MLYLMAIGPDGKEIARDEVYSDVYAAAKDGIGYGTSMDASHEYNFPTVVSGLADLRSESLIAYDIGSGKVKWNYTLPVTDPVVVTLNESNVGGIIPSDILNRSVYQVNNMSTFNDTLGNVNISLIDIPEVIPGDGRIYVQYRSINYQSPIILGQSKAAYISGVYALDENGSLLWNRTVSASAYDMNVVNNSTILYRNGDGRLVLTHSGAAIGFALTAILYIFIRFICVGAIARAHSRINKNENRNAVYDFIAKNPGLTMYEVSRGLKMNLGTVRYHAFILGMNHRIVPYKDDGKYVRYFTNSNSYNSEDQLIVSLMRREAMGKVLGYIMTCAASSNAEMAHGLGIHESIVSRSVKELAEKGVIVKETYGTKSVYTIVDAHRERVASAMRRIYGE